MSSPPPPTHTHSLSLFLPPVEIIAFIPYLSSKQRKDMPKGIFHPKPRYYVFHVTKASSYIMKLEPTNINWKLDDSLLKISNHIFNMLLTANN